MWGTLARHGDRFTVTLAPTEGHVEVDHDEHDYIYLTPVWLPGEPIALWALIESCGDRNPDYEWVITVLETLPDGGAVRHTARTARGTVGDVPLERETLSPRVPGHALPWQGIGLRRASGGTIEAAGYPGTTVGATLVGLDDPEKPEEEYTPVRLPGEPTALWVHAWTNGSSICRGNCVAVLEATLDGGATGYAGELNSDDYSEFAAAGDPIPMEEPIRFESKG